MKKFKIIISKFIAWLLFMVVIYLLGAFLAWNLNPGEWIIFSVHPWLGRLLLTPIIAIITFVVIVTDHDDEEII